MLLGGTLLGLVSLIPTRLAAQPMIAQAEAPRAARVRVACPTDLETLTTALLRDLPSYINRVSLRTLPRQTGLGSYAVATSRPDLRPLPTISSEYTNPQEDTLHQVFFTVLERQYTGRQPTELQHYHWLFLAQTPTGWRVALMFSRLGPYPSNQQPLTPPRESSQGITAQAIRSWLNNCQAGAIRPQ